MLEYVVRLTPDLPVEMRLNGGGSTTGRQLYVIEVGRANRIILFEWLGFMYALYGGTISIHFMVQCLVGGIVDCARFFSCTSILEVESHYISSLF